MKVYLNLQTTALIPYYIAFSNFHLLKFLVLGPCTSSPSWQKPTSRCHFTVSQPTSYTSLTDSDAVQLCSNTALTANKQHQLAFTAHFHTKRSALLCRTVQSRNTWIW